MCDDAVASARTFLAEHLTERRVVEQTRIDEMLRQLVAVEALLSVLDHMDTADAAQHRTACRKERDHLIAGLSGHLYAWQLAGGRVVLLSPEGVPADAAEPAGQQALVAEPLAEPTGELSDLVIDEITQATIATTHSARTPDFEAGDVDAASSDQLEALRRSMGRWQESPLASPAAGTGVDVSASLQRLGRLLDHIDLPDINALLAGSLIDAETDALTDATENLDAEWGPLPAGYQRLLLSMYTCYVRYLQDLLSETDPLRMRLTSVFHRLVNFSRSWQPGRVNGLQLAHQPRHGSWLADAHDWLTQLRELAGLTADVAQSMRVKRDQGVATVAIEQILRDEGFTIPEAQLRAWSLLEQHNLTQRSKQTMAAAKLPRVAELFQSLRVRVGESHDECAGLRRTLLGLTDQPISVEGHFCDICGGSNNRRAALALVSRLRAERIERLLIVGGGDDSRADLDQLLAGWGIELRHVDGTKESHAQKDADLNMRWAQVMVVWGGTLLPHKISNLYRNPPDGLRAVNPNRRGIEALCRSVIESFDRQ